jgi:hypothetical protein
MLNEKYNKKHKNHEFDSMNGQNFKIIINERRVEKYMRSCKNVDKP